MHYGISKEPLIKSDNSFNRHSGACRNPVKTIVYWMLVFTSMTAKGLNQSIPKYPLVMGVQSTGAGTGPGMEQLFIAVFLLLLMLAAGASPAQAQAYHFGRPATVEEIRSWDIAVSPEGEGLPAGQGTAREGAQVYVRHCAVCHGPTGAEVMYPHGYPPPLVKNKELAPVTGHHIKAATHYWPYATTIWDYINRAMPMTSPFPPREGGEPSRPLLSPGTFVLSADEVYAVTAYLLYQGGIIGEAEVMDAGSLPKVAMPNRDGFIPADPTDWNPSMHLDPHVSPLSGRHNLDQ